MSAPNQFFCFLAESTQVFVIPLCHYPASWQTNDARNSFLAGLLCFLHFLKGENVIVYVCWLQIILKQKQFQEHKRWMMHVSNVIPVSMFLFNTNNLLKQLKETKIFISKVDSNNMMIVITTYAKWKCVWLQIIRTQSYHIYTAHIYHIYTYMLKKQFYNTYTTYFIHILYIWYVSYIYIHIA